MSWAALREKLELDHPVPMRDSVYLGCGQKEFTPTWSDLASHCDFHQRLFKNQQPVPTSDDSDNSGVRGEWEVVSEPKVKIRDATQNKNRANNKK